MYFVGVGKWTGTERKDLVRIVLVQQQSDAFFSVSTSTFSKRERIDHQDIRDNSGPLGRCLGHLQCKCELYYMFTSLSANDTIWKVIFKHGANYVFIFIFII